MSGIKLLLPTLIALLPAFAAAGETVLVEAETFVPSSPGWQVASGPETRSASGLCTLHGASGRGDAVAEKTVTLASEGHYRIWVRYRSLPDARGPFRVTALGGGRELASAVFDQQAEPQAPGKKRVRNNDFVWKFLEAQLPAGEVVLRLSKHEGKNCNGQARHVDCLLLTTDAALTPDHSAFGAQTYLRVTFGDGYERPVYLHLFADHYRAPWYKHYSIGRGGVVAAVRPEKGDLLKSGERTPWCNITPMLYQDTGALLTLSARFTYAEPAPHLLAKLEFATAPDEKAVVRTINADCRPGGMMIVVPPDLTTPENLSRFKTDREMAEETGKRADAFDWPNFGKPPQVFPFLVRANLDRAVDAAVNARERKTLGYFGFTPDEGRHFHAGIWFARDGSYSNPDLDRMRAEAAKDAAAFRQEGRSLKDVLYVSLTDEPKGQTTAILAKDRASAEAFRQWLKGMGLTPADLLVTDWDAVRPVTEAQAKQFPALHYYTQRFRTRALGEFMATQRRVLEGAYGGPLKALANFSDGAIYNANFYAQGVDYFELLENQGQNAIWGEDWANAASTYQCAAFNVELMRAAARRHGQTIGHFLISYAGRTPWDAKLKAVGEVARGVKILESFHYGPVWSSHEGGPAWKSTAWAAKPEMWRAEAELVREIGAAEDLLVPAMPAPAEVAILYSSSSDAWTAGGNLAYGFDRMHTWLALAHGQVPADIVSEADVADGHLADYKVCYLSGPNLTRAAAAKLADWVRGGGTLWLTAGAAARDEYDRPLKALNDLMPASRSAAADLQPHHGSGRPLQNLRRLDEVSLAGGTRAEVLSVKQTLEPRPGAEVLGHYADGSAALVRAAAGNGTVYQAGFLPALAYIKAALAARERSQSSPRAGDSDLLARSYNPWEYPAAIRALLTTPTRSAGIAPPVTCDAPLVDAVYMTCDRGVLVPLANYTLRPIADISLSVHAPHEVSRVESSRRGRLEFTTSPAGRVDVRLPLEATDFLKLYFAEAEPKR